MPRFVVERDFPSGLKLPVSEEGAKMCRTVVDVNADAGVTWIHSYFSTDNRKSYCIYDGPTPEAIRKVAVKNRLPINRITEVRVLDPYFYRAA